MDKIFFFCGRAVLALAYALISIAVFMDDSGPAIFTQRRVGKDRRILRKCSLNELLRIFDMEAAGKREKHMEKEKGHGFFNR